VGEGEEDEEWQEEEGKYSKVLVVMTHDLPHFTRECRLRHDHRAKAIQSKLSSVENTSRC
jgi:hypothetical protein